jgi:quercetin 2,3-dioxygenase
MTRAISRIDTTPQPKPGFIGEGHTAVEVVRPDALRSSDPFVLLADDRLDFPKRRQIGGAHPHAGLETVTLIIEGALHDRDEGELGTGDMIWMTAGRGIIHNEAVEAGGRARILQLWIALPGRDRDLAPQFEIVRRDAVPIVRVAGAEARLYSGGSGALRSSTRNRVPITMIDLALEPHARFQQDLPSSYNGFVYVLEGSVQIDAARIAAGQVGWLAPSRFSDVAISADERGARLLLYAGEPIGEPLIHHGPFVAGSPTEINGFYRRFRTGEFTSMSQLARTQAEEGYA